MRLGAYFVAICMIIIAACVGVVAHSAFGAGMVVSALVAVATLTGLAGYHVSSTRGAGLGNAVNHQLAHLARGQTELARQLAETQRRVAAVEVHLEGASGHTRSAAGPIVEEIGELGLLVRQLAETVAAQQAELERIERQRPPMSPERLRAEALAQLAAETAAPPLPKTTVAPPAAAPAPSLLTSPPVAPAVALPQHVAAPQAVNPSPPVSVPAAAEPAPPAIIVDAAQEAAKEAARAAALAAIRAAIDGNRIDLHLQPIVTLPQRKVRYYEALARLRDDRSQLVPAAEFVPVAERAGLMPRLDNLVMFRCVQVVRRLLLKNRDVGLFCNLSGSTLLDAESFPQLIEFMDANRAIAPALVLELPQQAVRAMGPIEHESLAALAERGFRFSMDNVTDLRIEPRELANRGFRFIKVHANLLLNRSAAAPSDIHPADLSDLVGRFGIDLIAERIESEGSVVDLLDCDVRYGQGFLFSPPRPVRAEALQGIASDLIGREPAAPPDPLAPARVHPAGAAEPAKETTRETARGASALAQLARGVVSRG